MGGKLRVLKEGNVFGKLKVWGKSRISHSKLNIVLMVKVLFEKRRV